MAHAARRLSAHFALAEFDCHDGTPVPSRGHQAYRLHVAWWLEPMRRRFGVCTVISGFRTHSHNAAVGGAPHSVHLLETLLPNPTTKSVPYAAAADVKFARGGPAEWARAAERIRRDSPHLAAKGRGGIGVYHGLGFVHLDTAARRNWTG